MRILLVEDEPEAARLLRQGACASRPMPSTSRRTAHARVLPAATTDYDAVILDVMLPGKTGLESLPASCARRARPCRSSC